MARLKFLLFALVVLGLWATQLYVLPPALSAQSVEEASARARLVPALAAAKLDARRMEVQRIALTVAGSPALVAPFVPPAPAKSSKAPEPPPVEVPGAELLKEVRSVVSPVIPEGFRRELVLGVVNGAGSLFVRGDEEPKAVKALDAAAKAGGNGQVLDAFDQPHVFYSFPVSVLDRPGGPPRQAATVVLGAPLVPTELLTDVAKAADLRAVALVNNGKVRTYGPDNAAIDAAAKTLQPGQTLVVSQGAVSDLGPFKLPVLTSGDVTGGTAPLLLATRQPLPGTPYDVLALVATRPLMGVLASFQRLTLLGFAGLLGLSLIWTLLMGPAPAAFAATGEQEEKKAKKRRGDTLGLTPTEFPPGPGVPLTGGHFQESPPPAPLSELPPPAGDFGQPWNNEAPAQAAVGMPGYGAQPGSMPDYGAQPGGIPDFGGQVAAMPPVPDWSESSGAPSGVPFPENPPPMFDAATTRAYPVPSEAALDSYPLPPTPAPQEPNPSNPETTRVSAIPAELLRAAARPTEPAAIPLPGAPSPAGAEEQQHFQQVYQEFVSTREKCGEAADGLTYDKFVQKLRKNKEQLIQKYNCRSVRFVVYVKDGKAALKATPVKD